MKTIKLMISMMLIAGFVQSAMAKTQKIGLYLTAEDYMSHKLSYESDGSNGNQIRLHSFIGSNVAVTQNGKERLFSKNEIFGYRIDNQDYRYFNNSEYRIIDTQGFYIYAGIKLIPQGKGPKQTEVYYFSSKANDAIKPLTINNLESVFSKDTRFVYAMEGSFKSDNELTAFDANLKEYKIKYLYAQSAR
jgi:hypothetical protein